MPRPSTCLVSWFLANGTRRCRCTGRTRRWSVTDVSARITRQPAEHRLVVRGSIESRGSTRLRRGSVIAESSHDGSVVHGFIALPRPPDMPVTVPPRNEVHVHMRHALTAGRAVVLPHRQPVRSQPCVQQRSHRSHCLHQRGRGRVVEVPDAFVVGTWHDQRVAKRRRTGVQHSNARLRGRHYVSRAEITHQHAKGAAVLSLLHGADRAGPAGRGTVGY